MERLKSDTEFADDLQEWLCEEAPDPDRDPTVDEAVTRLLRRIRRCDIELERVRVVGGTEMEKTREWMRRKSAGPAAFKDDAERQLEALIRSQPRTSISVPAGRVGLSKPGPGRLVAHDEPAAVAYLALNAPDLVRTVQSVDKASLKAIAIGKDIDGTCDFDTPDDVQVAAVYLPDTGEAIPGLHHERDKSKRFGYKVAE